MSKPYEKLVGVLLDVQAEYGDRHDAAMDLSAFDGSEVENALAKLACDADADKDLTDACGESLAEIWSRRGGFNAEVISRLVPNASFICLETLRAMNPSLAKIAATQSRP